MKPKICEILKHTFIVLKTVMQKYGITNFLWDRCCQTKENYKDNKEKKEHEISNNI